MEDVSMKTGKRSKKMDQRQVVVVSGASQGLGAAVARCLAAPETAVCLVARSTTGLKTVEADIRRNGGEALAVLADVADSDACREVIEKTVARWGRLDALVNNAGIIGPLAPTVDTDPAAWRQTLAVNLMGPYYLARLSLPWLRRSGGRIVNVSSGAATTALPAAGAYCVSKAALNHFTRILAAEEPGVTAVAVRPGVVDTPMQTTLRETAPGVMPRDLANYYQNLKADGRLEPPEVPGRSIAWLALHAPRSWSGRFLNYDDQEIVTAVKAWMTDR